MSALDELGVAAHRKIRAQAELAEANAALARALVSIHQDGIRKCRVGEIARIELGLHGFEQDMIGRLGLSDANVRVLLDRITK